MANLTTERTLTELDHVRLSQLVERDQRAGASASGALPLEEVLDGSDLVASRDVGADVITMNSRFQVRLAGMDEPRQLTLCFPADADPEKGHVSVLSPFGWALVGQRVGAEARWSTPDGEQRTATILSMQYQPEAAGDLTT